MNDVPTVDISIVIPARDEEAYLGACLDAIAGQLTIRVVEVIVVDNGSTDSTRAIAEARGVRVIAEPILGVGQARKAGTDLAQGTYILHIDADTQLPSGFVEDALSRFAQDPRLVCLGGQMMWYDATAFANRIRGMLFFLLVPIVRIISRGALGPMGNNMMFPRAVYLQCRGFDASLRFGEDADVSRQLRAYGTVRLDLSLLCPTSGRRYRWGKGLVVYIWNATRICLGFSPRTNELPSLEPSHQHSAHSIDR